LSLVGAVDVKADHRSRSGPRGVPDGHPCSSSRGNLRSSGRAGGGRAPSSTVRLRWLRGVPASC